MLSQICVKSLQNIFSSTLGMFSYSAEYGGLKGYAMTGRHLSYLDLELLVIGQSV